MLVAACRNSPLWILGMKIIIKPLLFKPSLGVNFPFGYFHLYVVENACLNSPERQTFVTDGWFAAGDFLQQQKNTNEARVYHSN